MEYVHNLIWLCPLLFIAGFIDSIAGGGGLIALPAYMMCGMPIYYVYGCNKFQCAFGSTIAAWKYFKSGCLDLKVTLISACLLYTSRLYKNDRDRGTFFIAGRL